MKAQILKTVKSLAVTLFVGLTVASCSNDDNNTQAANSNATCKLAKLTYDNDPQNAYTATYTGNNITQLVSTSKTEVYTYDAENKIIKYESFNAGSSVVRARKLYTYNSDGYAIEILNYELSGNTLVYDGKTTLAYTADKATQISYYDASNTLDEKEVYTWTGSNPTNVKTYIGNALDCNIDITYDTTKTNKLNAILNKVMFIGNYDFYTSLATNVVSSTHSTCGNITDNFTTTYTAEGYIDTVTSSINGIAYKYEYTGCN